MLGEPTAPGPRGGGGGGEGGCLVPEKRCVKYEITIFTTKNSLVFIFFGFFKKKNGQIVALKKRLSQHDNFYISFLLKKRLKT